MPHRNCSLPKRLRLNAFHAPPLLRHAACNELGMATLPASTRPAATNVALRQQSIGLLEVPERRSRAAACREKLVLFTRRRMLDWRSQATRLIVVGGGSVLVFMAWKSLISWLA